MRNTDKPFKLVILGDRGVGKTTFVKRHLTGEFNKKYEPTYGADVYPLQFETNRGPIRFSCWDTAGPERFGSLRDGYYVNADCAILVFDVTYRRTQKNLATYYRDIRRVCPNIPVIVVGNKQDVMNKNNGEIGSKWPYWLKPINYNDNNLNRNTDLTLGYAVSAKSNYNTESPFVYLARKLYNDNDLELVDALAIQPPEVEINGTNLPDNDLKLQTALAHPLPNECELD